MTTLLHQRPSRVGPFSAGTGDVTDDIDAVGGIEIAAVGDGSPTSSPSPIVGGPGRRLMRLARRAALIALIAGLLAAGVFWATGGRWFVVQTPSMGTAAPVGALVLTRPVAVTDLRVGDVIAFHPSTEPATYTHRIVSINGSGPGTVVHTRGDINGATDPWSTDQAHLIGRAVVLAPGLGYLVKALPLLAVGGFVLWLITHLWIPTRWRYTVRMLGSSALYLLAATRIRPYVGVLQLTTTTGADGDTQMSVVSTGILPIRVVATSGTAAPLDLSYGQTGVVNLTNAVAGRYDLATHLHLSPGQWALAVVIWLLPFAWSLVKGHRAKTAPARQVIAVTQ